MSNQQSPIIDESPGTPNNNGDTNDDNKNTSNVYNLLQYQQNNIIQNFHNHIFPAGNLRNNNQAVHNPILPFTALRNNALVERRHKLNRHRLRRILNSQVSKFKRQVQQSWYPLAFSRTIRPVTHWEKRPIYGN